MRYKSPAAFRTALEARLLGQSLETNVPLARLRKMVAFDRLLARLGSNKQDEWVVKGGLALQLRLGNMARTTKDIDAATATKLTNEQATSRLRKAAAAKLGDWFEFEVSEPTLAATGAAEGGLRFPILCLVDGRNF